MKNRSIAIYLLSIGLLLGLTMGWYGNSFLSQHELDSTSFDGSHAYEDVKTQVAF